MFLALLTRFFISFVELLLTSAQNCPHHLALGLDELSSLFLTRKRNSRTVAHHINKPFLIWLNDSICQHFENNFVVDQMPESSSSFPLEFMRSLNRPEDFQSTDAEDETHTVAINIAGCVLNPSAKWVNSKRTNPLTESQIQNIFFSSLASIQVLSSLFNLMGHLFSRLCNGVLTQIDALIGAPIVLPKIMLSPDNRDVDLFDELDDERARQVLDMHFYTVNYWRECISAFVTQANQLMRRKVLTRLTEVIELENKIREIMQTAPDDYVPPVCQFGNEKAPLKFKRPPGLTRHSK